MRALLILLAFLTALNAVLCTVDYILKLKGSEVKTALGQFISNFTRLLTPKENVN